jgi:transcriptional regulator of acetoin/glycerol metabolism
MMRPAIRRSWHRSSLSGVDRQRGSLVQADLTVNLDTELHIAAAPVLSKFEVALGVPAIIALSDGAGRFLRFWSSEAGILRRFEEVGAYPGASAGEDQVGTNAIGTALEDGRPMVVVRSEHYQQSFEQITCAAALVRHPLTKRMIGSIALAALKTEDTNDMLSLVVKASRAVEQRLLERASAEDRRVLEALKMRGGGAHRSVVGISRNMMIANEPAMRLRPRLDQTLLWERARETVESGRERSLEIAVGADLDPLAVRCVPVYDADVTVGALIDFGCADASPRRPALVARNANKLAPLERKPGRDTLVGCSREARHLDERIARAAMSSGAVLVSGEAGAGKAAVARAILALRIPRFEPITVNCSDAQAAERLAISATPDAPVLFAHLELLSTATAYRLRDALRRSPELQRCWVATINTSTSPSGTEPCPQGPLLDEFGGLPVEVPGLRYRRDDIAPLAKHFSQRAGTTAPRLSPEAMQLLLRYPWPGNIRELKNVVDGALASTSRDIELEDLPVHLHRQATRRPLSPLEQAEADAILAAMRACRNNKVKAAEMLQISRSRLYRKASAYGLVGAMLG